jgi:hypothetical protein
MNDLPLTPHPQEVKETGPALPRPTNVRLNLRKFDVAIARDISRFALDLLDLAGIEAGLLQGSGLPVTFDLQRLDLKPEGYELKIAPEGITLTGVDPAGLFYAQQTLLQVLALRRGDLPQLDIRDWPHYKTRELMLDLGRAPFALPALKRAIRLMARLKLNSLHLHLNDDQLCGLRFDRLPLGSENPWAITLDDLRQLVAYGRQFHVRIVPEIECWGHAGSFCHHYPHLRGGPGMWGGVSFGLGEELYALLEQVFDEIVPVLEPACDVHVGLDEAIWATLPSVSADRKDQYTPERHVGRLYEMLERVGDRHGRKVRMRLWADHGGRPVPEAIRDKVLVEPWQYAERREQDILDKAATFGGAGKPPFMMGAGMSSLALQGSYGATRLWAQAGAEHPNVEGIDLCLWENNNLAGQLLGIYAGADYAWSPATPALEENDPVGEILRGELLKRMKQWQAAFPEAQEAAIRLDTGDEVHAGFYVSGPLAGRPVARM